MTEYVKIRVLGGVVQNVEVPIGVCVLVYDYDIDGADESECDKDEAGELCSLAVYENEIKLPK